MSSCNNSGDRLLPLRPTLHLVQLRRHTVHPRTSRQQKTEYGDKDENYTGQQTTPQWGGGTRSTPSDPRTRPTWDCTSLPSVLATNGYRPPAFRPRTSPRHTRAAGMLCSRRRVRVCRRCGVRLRSRWKAYGLSVVGDLHKRRVGRWDFATTVDDLASLVRGHSLHSAVTTARTCTAYVPTEARSRRSREIAESPAR